MGLWDREERKPTMLLDGYGDLHAWAVVVLWLGCLVVPIVVFGAPFILISGIGGANGRHVGIVTAIEDRVNVTWDSTLVHFKTDAESTQEDVYCVTDADVRRDLERYAETRERVVIRYRNDLFMMRWECNGGQSIIVGVDPTSVEE